MPAIKSKQHKRKFQNRFLEFLDIYEKYLKIPTHYRRGVGITDSAKTLGQIFGYRNMEKAAILDPNAKKNQKFWAVLGLF